MKLNWINTLPDGETTKKVFAFLPDKEGVENHVVNLYPEITFQTMEGFGGAITDAAGYVYSLMKEDQRRKKARRQSETGISGVLGGLHLPLYSGIPQAWI